MNSVGKEHHKIEIPSASSQLLSVNLPCPDLLDYANRDEYLKICFPLYIASMEGDWKAAKDVLDKHKKLVRYSITRNHETALHVAVSRGNTTFVKKLVSLMEDKDLELQDNNSYTALCTAVTAGYVKIAEILLHKNKALMDIPTCHGILPLQMAASSEKTVKMVEFLYKYTQGIHYVAGVENFWSPESRSCFLSACVEADCFDVALQVLRDQPELGASMRGTLLRVLAQKPHAFKPKSPSGLSGVLHYLLKDPEMKSYNECTALHLLRCILRDIANLTNTEIDDIMRGPADPIEDENTDAKRKYSSRVLFLAAEVGNSVFIYEVARQYPEILHEVNDINQSIFHVAVSHRHEDIFVLLYEIGSTKDRIIILEDQYGNNMLHLVGIFTESAKSNCDVDVPGAAQKLQRELLWFKEVKSMIPTSFHNKKNSAGWTPREEFTKHHKGFVTDGEKWMKDTCAQLMVVAALLASITFAATITFAGGFAPEGYPVLVKKRSFSLFIVYTSIAFLCASGSMLNILALLTSRYAEDDFLKLLHHRLMMAVTTFILSIVFMIIAFCSNLYMLFEMESKVLAKVLAYATMAIFFLSFKSLRRLAIYIRYGFGKAELGYKRRLMPSYEIEPISH